MSNLIGRRIGHYEIIEEIGRGGMATVYKAFQKSLNRYVAIKVLPLESAQNEELVERFRREALSAGKLSHPNILHIYDAGSTDEFHYIIMDYVPTGTLKEKMVQGAIDIKAATRLGAQVADALNHAHSRGVIHRDLKPSNVLLSEEGNTLLADFGIAQAVGETRLTRTGTSIGTPEYMSPEQCQGQAVDARSDIYSLGVVIYEMLAGIVPFQANTPLATLYKHINEPPPPLRQVNMRVPPELERVVMKALEKDPAARYQSAGEFARALRGELVPAPADGAATRLVGSRQDKVSSKPQAASRGTNRTIIAGIALLAIVVLGGLGYLFFGRGGGEARVTPTTIAVASATKEPTDTKIPPTTTHTSLPPTKTSIPLTATPLPPTPTERIVIITATPIPPTLTERVIIITATPLPATDTPMPTDTPAPTDTPEPPDTAAPPPKPTEPPVSPPTAPPPLPSGPSVVMDFEQMAAWRRGDEPNGTFTQSSAQVHDGNYAGKLDYDFGSTTNDYVVFMQTKAIPGEPNLLKMWVYGDGSGHLLNAWIKDGAGQVWQTTFGAVDHQGWQEMLALVETGQEWPWAHISGPDNGKVDYPISFFALVLDDVPDGYTGKGTIFVDELSAETYELPAVSVQPTAEAPAQATGAPGGAPGGAINVAALQGLMAFDVTRPGYPHPDIWLMNANGTGMSILVEGAGWPGLRPDGRQIVYQGLASNRLRLFRIDRDGSYDTPLTEYTEDTMPSWASYATMIVFASKRDVRKQWELFTMTADGQNQTRILANVNSRMPVWIPGPIVYSGCLVKDPGKCGLVAVNEDGSGGRLITDNTNDMQPSASPDGQWLAFMSLRDGNWEIYKAPVTGGAVQRLTEHPAHDGLPAWSPSGNEIAFASNRDGVWAIYVMRTDGSAATKITDLKGDYLSWPEGRLQWSRNE